MIALIHVYCNTSLYIYIYIYIYNPVVDPGFPVGGMHPLGGGMDL